MSDYWYSATHIAVPVKLVDAQWELAYGGGTRVREGAFAELCTALSNIEGEETKRRLTQIVTVPVLSMGTASLIALSISGRNGTIAEYKGENVVDVPKGCARFVCVAIGRSARPSHPTKRKAVCGSVSAARTGRNWSAAASQFRLHSWAIRQNTCRGAVQARQEHRDIVHARESHG